MVSSASHVMTGTVELATGPFLFTLQPLLAVIETFLLALHLLVTGIAVPVPGNGIGKIILVLRSISHDYGNSRSVRLCRNGQHQDTQRGGHDNTLPETKHRVLLSGSVSEIVCQDIPAFHSRPDIRTTHSRIWNKSRFCKAKVFRKRHGILQHTSRISETGLLLFIMKKREQAIRDRISHKNRPAFPDDRFTIFRSIPENHPDFPSVPVMMPTTLYITRPA